MKKPKHKTLCKLVKGDALEDDPGAYRDLVRRPTHLCMKCGRVSRDPDRLCRPEPLEAEGPVS